MRWPVRRRAERDVVAVTDGMKSPTNLQCVRWDLVARCIDWNASTLRRLDLERHYPRRCWKRSPSVGRCADCPMYPRI